MAYDTDFYEVTNALGHRQIFQHDPELGDFPVCSESRCRAAGYLNNGGGMACHTCRDRMDAEWEANK